MATYTRDDIRKAFDTKTASVLGGTPIIPVIYGNVEDVDLSNGTDPFVKQRVVFSSDKQMDLGNMCARRIRGYVSFLIHVKYNTGDLVRDQLLERLSTAFRSTYIGGATTLDAQVIASTRAENWAITPLQIPFYYETHT